MEPQGGAVECAILFDEFLKELAATLQAKATLAVLSVRAPEATQP